MTRPTPGELSLVVRTVVVVLAGGLTSASVRAEVRYNEHIRPLFAEHCLQCHGPDATHREGDLRLDVEQAAKRMAIVPHHPDKSELLRRVISHDPDLRMPPAATGKRLTADEVDLLRRWISEGAAYDQHWAFEPVRRPDVPTPRGPARTTIDRFVVESLESRGLRLSPPLSRERLIRRATFDLTGLPPTWAEVEAFVNDESPSAYEKVLDRLLASSRYGERWGRHWLDLARYADTHGGSAIGFKKFPFSYTYRDYVIRSFNDDVPYNRFVTEQLAADQLGLDENAQALAGLGFLTVGMQYRNPHDVIDDQIDVITRGLLGLTVACARCHDHKYDAIPTTDYYALYATLASSTQPDLLPILGTPADSPPLRDYQAELSRRQIVFEDMGRDQSEVMRSRLRMQVGLYLKELARGTPEQDLSATFLSYRTDDLRPLVLNRWRKYLAEMPANDPVFGPWVQLTDVQAEGFGVRCRELIESLGQQNGDPAKFANPQRLSVAAPKWNPRVLRAIQKREPRSLEHVAEAYGALFAEIHQEWLKSLLAATLEAASDGTVIPDEDPRHVEINSAVNAQLRRHLYGPGTPTAVPEATATTLLNRTVRDNLNGKKGAIHNLHLTSPGSPPRAMVLLEELQPPAFYVFRRGNPIDRGAAVPARFLTALSTPDASAFPDGQRRLALAQAIIATDNPLTRRVIVNWVWQHHFGQGLVRTSDDFGVRGDSPTHPQLLDYLAETLLEDGWSLKKLQRRIMLSDVYRQAAIEAAESRLQDPGNELLWRMPRRRLELEAMRDAMLMVSGELDEAVGGRPFDLLSRPVVPRRSVYGFVNRDIISGLASTFDAANPNSCTARRPQTSVPQQTLFALNSDFIQDRAAAFAKLATAQVPSGDAERVHWMYRRALSRSPSAEELELSMRYVRSQTQTDDARGSTTLAWQQFAHVLLASNEFVFLD